MNAIVPAGAYPPFVSSVPLIIGGSFSGAAFAGTIDDVRIWNRALSDSEVESQFVADAPKTPKRLLPIAYYPLDGDAKDKGGSHLDGTLMGTTPTRDRFGKKDKALFFNGVSDRINCGNPAAFNFAGNFTLSAWVKLNGDQTDRYIIAKYDFLSSPPSMHAYGFGTDGNAVSYGFVLGDGPGYDDLRGAVSLNDDQWHAIAFAFEGNRSLRLYVDGNLVGSRSVGGYPPFTNSVPLIIGGAFSGPTFSGAIDDVRIFDNALSDAEILDMYKGDIPKTSATTGLVAYYPLNGDASDRSRNHLDGTLNGTTPTTDRFGKSNKALSFNGISDFVNCGNPAAFNFTNSFTLSTWVKLNGNQINKYVIAKYDPNIPTAHSYGLGAAFDSLPYGFVLGDGPGYDDLYAPISMNDDQWHALAMVFQNGNSLQLYLDGQLAGIRGTGIYPPFVNDIPLVIGGTISDQLFSGAIDDVRIYNRGLSSVEIADLYANESP